MAVSELWIALALFLLSNVKLGESDFKCVIGVVVYQGFWGGPPDFFFVLTHNE